MRLIWGSCDSENEWLYLSLWLFWRKLLFLNYITYPLCLNESVCWFFGNCCPADFVDTSSVLLPFLLELIVWLFYLQDICSSSYNYSAAQTWHFFFLLLSFVPLRTATVGEGKSQTCRSCCSKLIGKQAYMSICRLAKLKQDAILVNFVIVHERKPA